MNRELATSLSRSAVTGFVAVALVVLMEAAIVAPEAAVGGARSVALLLLLGVTLATVGGLVGAATLAGIDACAHFGAGALERRWVGLSPARGFDAAGDVRGDGMACWIHGVFFAAAFAVGGSARITAVLVARFHSPDFIGILSAVLALGVIVVALLVGLAIVWLLRGRRLLPPRLARWDPLVDARVALATWIGLGWVVIGAALLWWHAFAIAFPLRIAVASTLAVLLILEGRRITGALFDDGRLRRGARAAAAVLIAVSAGALVTVTDPVARRAALRSPVLELVVTGVRVATDLDRDGYGFLLGEGDCAPLDSSIHPGAADVPGDGIDQNCTGSDYVPAASPSPYPSVPVPEDLKASSVLLVTVDTLRYDHTTPSGYEHDTTPNLAALSRRGVWFDEAHATSSKTRESLPSLVASQFLVELPIEKYRGIGPAFPDFLSEDAVTLAEVLREQGFRTAMFTGYHYFDTWRIDQGMEHHVNMPTDLPYRTAPELTEQALQWLEERDPDERWFVWVHYFEPHDPYERQDGVPEFGGGLVGNYDGEIYFVDQQLGRLMEWIDSDPDRRASTLVVVTSDHGEWLGEDGRFGHDDGVWRDLLHVPLLFAAPNGPTRRSETPASTIDLAPTIAALLGVEPDPSWTGRALTAEIAVGGDDPDRIIYAADEDAGHYAAIGRRWKLLRDEYANLYQLIDVAADPGEARDVSREQPEVFEKMREALIGWRERILGSDPFPGRAD